MVKGFLRTGILWMRSFCQNNVTLRAGWQTDMHPVDFIRGGSMIGTQKFNRRAKSPGALQMNKNDLYEVVTQKIVERLEARIVPIVPVFKKMGIIDQWGNGLKLIANELKGYPEFDINWFEKGLHFQLQFIKKMSKQSEQPELQPESLFNLVLKALNENSLTS